MSCGLLEQYLILAIEEGDLDGIRLQKKRGVEILKCVEAYSKQTAIHLAISHDKLGCLNLLLEIFPEETKKILFVADNTGKLPIHLACRVSNVDMTKALLSVEGTGSIQANAGTEDAAKLTPLHFAAQYCKDEIGERFASLLIEYSAIVGKTNANGETPLHTCSKYDNDTVAEVIIKEELKENNMTISKAIKIVPKHNGIEGEMPAEMCVNNFFDSIQVPLTSLNQRAAGLTPLHIAAFYKSEKVSSLTFEANLLRHSLLNTYNFYSL